MELQASSARTMPVLDEETFQQILEAAYVLQGQNEAEVDPVPVERSKLDPPPYESKAAVAHEEVRIREADTVPAPRPKLDPAQTLSEIAAAQEAIHSKQTDLPTSARIICEQLSKITHAVGVAVAVVRANHLEYLAAVGSAASLSGLSVPVDENLSAVLHTDTAALKDIDFLEGPGGRSPLLFPVYNEKEIAGLIDVRFDEAAPVQEQEVGSCQVMAGLMGEAIARSLRAGLKRALVSERATIVEVLERLRPQLERLAGEEEPAKPTIALSKTKRDIEVPEEKVQPEPLPAADLAALVSAIGEAEPKTEAVDTCQQCGYRFGEAELFCGRCGTPRSMAMLSLEPAQQGWIFPEEAEQQPPVSRVAAETESAREEPLENLKVMSESGLPLELERALADFSRGEELAPEGTSALAPEPETVAAEPEMAPVHAVEATNTEATHTTEPEIEAKPEIVPQTPAPQTPPAWASASKTLKWLKSLETASSPQRIWLEKHRGDISVALSALVLLLALSGAWSHTPERNQTPPQPSLTLFERALVGLGLAEAPPAAAAMGNPNLQVWVDVHTALYYCPGSELYGKTPDGRIETQRDAQLDQFSPATRENCR